MTRFPANIEEALGADINERHVLLNTVADSNTVTLWRNACVSPALRASIRIGQVNSWNRRTCFKYASVSFTGSLVGPRQTGFLFAHQSWIYSFINVFVWCVWSYGRINVCLDHVRFGKQREYKNDASLLRRTFGSKSTCLSEREPIVTIAYEFVTLDVLLRRQTRLILSTVSLLDENSTSKLAGRFGVIDQTVLFGPLVRFNRKLISVTTWCIRVQRGISLSLFGYEIVNESRNIADGFISNIPTRKKWRYGFIYRRFVSL